MGKATASEINNWYTNLTNVRTRFGLSSATYPIIVPESSMTANLMNNVDVAMTNVVTDQNATSYNKISKLLSYEVTSGTLLSDTMRGTIETNLATWLSACVNHSVCSTQGTCGTQSRLSSFGSPSANFSVSKSSCC